MKNEKLTFDLPQYIAQIKMSSKVRLLVEGRDDRTHLKNLLFKLGKSKVRIDTAEQIKGNCQQTSKNNRGKIDKIYQTCKGVPEYNNLYYLADREFEHFNISEVIEDNLNEDELEDNLYFTCGHSMENYFINSLVLQEAYSYLCASEYKNDALSDLESILPSAYSTVAAISLAAREINKSSYPLGVISWEAFAYTNSSLNLVSSSMGSQGTAIHTDFMQAMDKWLNVTQASPVEVCEMICRGHTAVVLLQRVFARCLYETATKHETENEAKKIANSFSKLSEKQLATSLGEAWIRNAAMGQSRYPISLIQKIA